MYIKSQTNTEEAVEMLPPPPIIIIIIIIVKKILIIQFLFIYILT